MNHVSSLFLRAKAWQLFILTVPLVLVELWAWKVGPSATLSARQLSVLLRFGSMSELIFIFLWAWSAGIFLNSILQRPLQFERPFFYFSLAYPVVYRGLNAVFPGAKSNAPIWLNIVLGGLSFISVVYVAAAVAKSLVSVETGKPATFWDYAPDFCSIWFFPIGVWLIQPKINRLSERAKNFTPSNSAGHASLQLPS